MRSDVITSRCRFALSLLAVIGLMGCGSHTRKAGSSVHPPVCGKLERTSSLSTLGDALVALGEPTRASQARTTLARAVGDLRRDEATAPHALRGAMRKAEESLTGLSTQGGSDRALSAVADAFASLGDATQALCAFPVS